MINECGIQITIEAGMFYNLYRRFSKMKKIISILIIMILIISLSRCEKASSYTEQELIRNISEIIEEKYKDNNITYKLRSVYDYNDKLSYFVVDFSNNTYFYIQIREKDESLLWDQLYI